VLAPVGDALAGLAVVPTASRSVLRAETERR
jgi:hypothetical protein